jgi:hypothetical protein
MNYTSWALVPTTNPIAKRMGVLSIKCDLMIRGLINSIIVFGGAGCGKTYSINRALDAYRSRGLDPVHGNPASFKDILEAFDFAASMSGGKPSRVRPIFFDEADTVFSSEKSLNILKVALAPDRRDRVYQGQRLDAPVFISSNRHPDKFPAGKQPHIRAVFDRVPPLVVPINAYASWEYACLLAITTPMNRYTNVGRAISLDVQVRALEWFTDNAHSLAVVGPRALHGAAEIMSMNMPAYAEEIDLLQLLTSRPEVMIDAAVQHDWRDLILNAPSNIKKKGN